MTNQDRHYIAGALSVGPSLGLWVIQETVGRKPKAKILALVSTELLR